jgi:hypothetical protein
MQGDWTDGKAPNVRAGIRMGGSITRPLILRLASGESRAFNLVPNDSGDYRLTDPAHAEFDVLEEAEPDSWVIGIDPAEIVGCDGVQVELAMMSPRPTKDGRIAVDNLNVVLAVNGRSRLACRWLPSQQIDANGLIEARQPVLAQAVSPDGGRP